MRFFSSFQTPVRLFRYLFFKVTNALTVITWLFYFGCIGDFSTGLAKFINLMEISGAPEVVYYIGSRALKTCVPGRRQLSTYSMRPD